MRGDGNDEAMKVETSLFYTPETKIKWTSGTKDLRKPECLFFLISCGLSSVKADNQIISAIVLRTHWRHC